MATSTHWPWQRRRPKLGPLIAAADLAMAERRWRDAAALYEQVLAQRPGMAALRVQLAHACKELGWLDGAASHYAEAARSQPEDVDPLLYLGHMARAAGEPSTAADWYRRALAIDPACAAALSGIEAVAGAASAPDDLRRHMESRHFADDMSACRVHWDLSAPAGEEVARERRWFIELGHALAKRQDCVPVRYSTERGDYERCGPAGERIDSAALAMPASASMFVTMPGLTGSAAAMACSVGQAQAQLRARIVTLVPGGYARNDAPLIADSSCILAPPLAAAALRDNQWRLGGSAGSVVTVDSAESLQLAPVDRSVGTAGPSSIAPWLEALEDLCQPGRLATLAARPLRRLVQFGRFYPLPGHAGNALRLERLAGAYMTSGAGWIDGQEGRSGPREIRVFSAGTQGDPLVCRLMLRRNNPAAAAAAAAEWRTLEAEAPGTEHAHTAREKVFHLGTALADAQSTEIVGLVFHPRSQDHHWFEFVDRLSRHAEPMAISA